MMVYNAPNTYATMRIPRRGLSLHPSSQMWDLALQRRPGAGGRMGPIPGPLWTFSA